MSRDVTDSTIEKRLKNRTSKQFARESCKVINIAGPSEHNFFEKFDFIH